MQDKESQNGNVDLERLLALVEEAAGAVVMAGPEDAEALAAVEQIFEKVAAAAPEGDLGRLSREAVALIGPVLGERREEAAAVLDRLGSMVTDMQRAAAAMLAAEDEPPPLTPLAPPPPAMPRLEMPEVRFTQPPRSAAPPSHLPPLDPPSISTTLAAPAPAPAPAPVAVSAPPAPAARASRDTETIELLGDFLQEAEEGVDKVDALLIEIEQAGIEAERINALFRVFHTIKGVAASLEVGEVTHLAHATETLLDQARSGAAELSGERIECVFDAAALMRKLLASVRVSVERGTEFETLPQIAPMLARLGAALTGAAAPKLAKPPPPPAPTPPPAAPPPKVFSIAPPRSVRAAVARSLLPPGSVKPASVKPSAPPRVAAAKVVTLRPIASAEQPAQERPPQGAAQNTGGGKLRETVKVDLDRVDSIVEMIGELIIVESMVVNVPEIAALPSLRVRNYLSQLTKISRDLQNIAMRMRMVPVQGVFQKMARMVRDLSRKTGKNVVLVQSGESAEMDRSMVERIEDPLVHMIRNSVDHGIEPHVDDRTNAGKAAQATIKLSAFHEGGSIVIEIADDGRGLGREAILKKAKAQGLVREGENPSDAEVWGLIFLPGFSTAAQVTEISGRGVGMDVVKRNIESMRGRVTVTSTPGKGTTFRLILPLTLAIIEGMLVACGSERYIVPSLSIVESLKPTESMVHAFADRGELVNVRGEMLPLVRLQRLLGVGGEERAPTEALIVVVETMGRRVGLLVDDVITQQQVVIKPLGEGLGDTEMLAGAAILSDGRVGLILNVDRIGGVVGAGQMFRSRSMADVEAA